MDSVSFAIVISVLIGKQDAVCYCSHGLHPYPRNITWEISDPRPHVDKLRMRSWVGLRNTSGSRMAQWPDPAAESMRSAIIRNTVRRMHFRTLSVVPSCGWHSSCFRFAWFDQSVTDVRRLNPYGRHETRRRFTPGRGLIHRN